MELGKVKGSQLHMTVLSPEKIKDIHVASLEILNRIGVFIELTQALEILHGAGASIDGNIVRLPAPLVESALRTAPHRIVLANRDTSARLMLEGNRSYFRGSCDSNLILDPFTRERRAFMSSDYRFTARVVDACPHLHAGGCAGHAQDYPAEIRAQIAFKQSMLNMKKPFVAAPLNVQQMRDIFDMAALISGGYDKLRKAPFVVSTCEPTTPLGIYKDAAEILLLSARENIPVVWYGMPSAGTTAPCSAGGVLTVGNAETLAGLVLHQLQKPGAPFIYGMMPGMTDMRSTQWAYGSPDFALMLAAATDLSHSYGLPFYGTAGCSDAINVDEQAVAESTMLCLMGQLSGANLIHDVGYMAGNRFISPEMMVLTNELIEMADHATQQIDTSREELCLNLIEQVGPRGHFLELEHTLRNFRRFWHSNIFIRSKLPEHYEDEPETVRERINKKTKEIIDTHKVDPLPDNVVHELDELEKKWIARVGGI
jgi:trimethylamine--corrinoid protein Co-methyltransferase